MTPAELLAQRLTQHQSIVRFRPLMPSRQDIQAMRAVPKTARLADATECRLNAVQASDRAAADAQRAVAASHHAFALAKEGKTRQANAFAAAARTLSARVDRHRLEAHLATQGAIHATNKEVHPVYQDLARTEAYGANAEHHRASLWAKLAQQATAFFTQ